MNPLLAMMALTLTGAIGLGLVYAYQSVLVPRATVRSRIRPREGLRIHHPDALRSDGLARIPLLRVLPLSAESRERTRQTLERAGIDLRVNEYIAIRLGVSLAVGVVAAIGLSSIEGVAPGFVALAALAGVWIGWMLPTLYVKRARERRSRLIEEQLPDSLTAIAKSLRAGTGLMGALAYAAEETPEPLGSELRATMRELQLGRDALDAFPALAARVDNPDLDIAVTAILIQRSVGGNLSEILTNVSETIRERFLLLREIRVITSRQRLTANLTAGVPVLIAVAFITINPELGSLLFTTTVGRISLAVGIAFEIAGLLLIRKLARIEV